MISIATGYLVCLQIVQYPYRVFSVPTECLACIEDDKGSYSVFIVPTMFSTLTRCLVFLQCLACLKNYKCS
jgi:hypothetical protein